MCLISFRRFFGLLELKFKIKIIEIYKFRCYKFNHC